MGISEKYCWFSKGRELKRERERGTILLVLSYEGLIDIVGRVVEKFSRDVLCAYLVLKRADEPDYEFREREVQGSVQVDCSSPSHLEITCATYSPFKVTHSVCQVCGLYLRYQ